MTFFRYLFVSDLDGQKGRNKLCESSGKLQPRGNQNGMLLIRKYISDLRMTREKSVPNWPFRIKHKTVNRCLFEHLESWSFFFSLIDFFLSSSKNRTRVNLVDFFFVYVARKSQEVEIMSQLVSNINTTLEVIVSPSANMTNVNDSRNSTENPLCLLNRYCETQDDYIDSLYEEIYPSTGKWILIVVYIVTFIVGLVGNTLVCFAIWRNPNMRTVTNIYIVNLSVADLAVILVCLPSTLVVDVTLTWFFGTAFCKINMFIMVSSIHKKIT